MKLSHSIKTLSVLVFGVALLANAGVSQAAPKKGNSAQQAQSDVQTRVNINTANSAQLAATLKGVGLKKADAIVEYRSKFGDFKNIDELTEVKGIGAKTVAKNRHRISL